MNIYDDPDFSNLPGDVADLFALSGAESFFSLPDWYALVGERGFRDEGRTSLLVDDRARLGMVCRRVSRKRVLQSCTNLYTCEHELLGDSGNAASVRAFARDLASSVWSLASIRLEGLDPASPCFTALIEGIRAAGFVAKPYFGWGTWFEPTMGIDFEQYLSMRPSVLRNTWRRKRGTLGKSASAAFQIYRQNEDPGPLIAIYEDVRERSWKSAELFPRFVPGLIRLAARLGALRLGILTVDGKAAAAQFWLVWRGRATIYKLVYADEFSSLSPGTVLTMEMMRIVLEEDCPFEIDFGRGDDEYKKLWLGSRRERWGIEAANPRTWQGFALAARLGAGLVRDQLNARLRGIRGDIRQVSALNSRVVEKNPSVSFKQAVSFQTG